MERFAQDLAWIETQAERMECLVEEWANLNTGSNNIEGLQHFCATLQQAFGSLGGNSKQVSLPPRDEVDQSGRVGKQSAGPALSIVKHLQASRKVLLSGHMDTVFAADSPFQRCHRASQHHLCGPGVIDLKGGLVVMLLALECLERSELSGKLGWEVFLNSDEEVGSPSSSSLLQERAPHYDIGLVFEPPYEDGALVSARRGSAVYNAVIRGRAAHAGRAFHEGVNALVGALPFLEALSALNDNEHGTTLNIGELHAGEAVNVVPELAIVKFGFRADSLQAMEEMDAAIFACFTQAKTARPDLTFELHQLLKRAPKPFDAITRNLFCELSQCAEDLSLDPLQWRDSGGVCDGNTLAGAGLPCIDTLGAHGGGMHTHDEYVDTSRLVKRAQLVSLFLLRYAAGEISLSDKEIVDE